MMIGSASAGPPAAKASAAANANASHLAAEILVPVDPTAAGDGFNAGYLAARLSGSAPAQAASAAHRLAGDIISHPGALLPRSAAAMH